MSKILKMIGTGWGVRFLIRRLYRNLEVVIREAEGDSELRVIGRGVLEVFTLSLSYPFLSLLRWLTKSTKMMADVKERNDEESKSKEYCKRDFRRTDDQVIVVNTTAGLQRLMVSMNIEEKYVFKINIGRKTGMDATSSTGQWKRFNNLRYLGVLITGDGRRKGHIIPRIVILN